MKVPRRMIKPDRQVVRGADKKVIMARAAQKLQTSPRLFLPLLVVLSRYADNNAAAVMMVVLMTILKR
jgi:hypothetical protein